MIRVHATCTSCPTTVTTPDVYDAEAGLDYLDMRGWWHLPLEPHTRITGTCPNCAAGPPQEAVA